MLKGERVLKKKDGRLGLPKLSAARGLKRTGDEGEERERSKRRAQSEHPHLNKKAKAFIFVVEGHLLALFSPRP